MQTLLHVKIQESALIEKCTDLELEIKLLEFGLTPNSKVTMLRKAPFDGPIIIQTDNGQLALRTSEAKTILVKNP